MAIRRELAWALRKADEELSKEDLETTSSTSDAVRLQIVKTGIFGAALRVVEFWNPETTSNGHRDDQRTEESDPSEPNFTHSLSRRAYHAAANKRLRHELEPILTGPLAVVSFPSVAPHHLKAVLSILAPNSDFPAPKRKSRPTYHEPAVQSGLSKLLLLAARIESEVFDEAGIRWVGGIQGGIDGLRAQLVAMLQGVGANITNTLEAAGRSVYFTMEGRKTMLEDEQKGSD
jgi:large subunit ribosomal protein L10